MTEEERRVLAMVAGGRVTPQEGDLLLDSLVPEQVVAPPARSGSLRWLEVHRLSRQGRRGVCRKHTREKWRRRG